jgi:signal transduction histidine kinase
MVIKVGEGIIGEAVRTGETILVEDTAMDERFLAGVENCRSELCAPLKYNDKLLGAINVESDEARYFSAQDVNLLETLASQIAAALETNRLVGKLKQAQKLSVVGQMASSILHDIRNDIHQLYTCSDLMRNPKIDKIRLGALADMVKKSSGNIYSLIEDIFEFVKTSETKLNTKTENLALLLDAACDTIRSFAPDRIDVRLDADPTIELKLDQRRFERVLFNLATNSIEAMEGGGKLSIVGKLNDEGKAMIVVADTGCGIAEERLTQIWEPLYTFGKKEGTGLGMAIVKKIVEEHGFSISVESTPGEGTTFTIIASRSEGEGA